MKVLIILLASFLQTGDLIFQEACSGDTDDTIKEVTTSAGNYNFTHVGIVFRDESDAFFVLEATIPEVKITPLANYLYPEGEENCYPRSVIGRLKEPYQLLIPKAIEEGLSLIGKPYDHGYILGNDAYYCSELIYEIFLRANQGVPVFPLNVMTFKSPQTGDFTEGWIHYFERLGMEIPEGELGINPGAMSRSEILDLHEKK